MMRKPVHNQLGIRVIRGTVAKRRLRGPPRLRCIFRTDASRWPHRAAGRYGAAATTRSVSKVLIRFAGA
jgi:hypothetical protein